MTNVNPEIARIIVIRQALKLLAVGIKPNRAYTLSRCLRIAGEYTGKTYPLSRGKALVAAQDLKEFLDAQR